MSTAERRLMEKLNGNRAAESWQHLEKKTDGFYGWSKNVCFKSHFKKEENGESLKSFMT